jgi:hypothetical protein
MADVKQETAAQEFKDAAAAAPAFLAEIAEGRGRVPAGNAGPMTEPSQ